MFDFDKDRKKDVQKKIDEYWATYLTFTDKISNILRQLAFLEVSVFWVFTYKTEAHPQSLTIGFLMLILFFVSDALQYFVGLRSSYQLADTSQQKFKDDPKISASDIEKSREELKGTKFFFYLKMVFITLSSLIIIGYLFFCQL